MPVIMETSTGEAAMIVPVGTIVQVCEFVPKDYDARRFRDKVVLEVGYLSDGEFVGVGIFVSPASLSVEMVDLLERVI